MFILLCLDILPKIRFYYYALTILIFVKINIGQQFLAATSV